MLCVVTSSSVGFIMMNLFLFLAVLRVEICRVLMIFWLFSFRSLSVCYAGIIYSEGFRLRFV